MKVKRNRIDGSVLITVIFLSLVTFAVSQALSPVPSAAIQLVTNKNLIEDAESAGSQTIIRAGTPGIPGDVGPQGPRGFTGAQGPQGPQGEQGVQGIQGVQGVQGERGPQGEQGVKGETGMVGDQGAQGVKGEKGDKGDKGDTGATGPQGATGPMGPSGPSGTFNTSGFVESIACYSTDPKGKVPVGTLLFGNCESHGITGNNITIVTRP